MSRAVVKKAVAAQALALIQPHTLVGLGTGTTSHFFIEMLGDRCRDGLKIEAVASSEASANLAKKVGIPLIDINSVTTIDITVDGADEVDPHKQMIKGAGGALLREKILAAMSREMVVIIDQSKLVKKLGKKKLPVEIVPFGYPSTLHHLEKLGYHGTLRKADSYFYITDNGNYIVDIHFEHLCEDPQMDHLEIIQVPGVVETGFFFNLAGKVIVGFDDGQITTF